MHFPKAGGTSIRGTLAHAFSPADLLLDYDDDPADPDCLKWTAPGSYESNKPTTLRARCVHGHFRPDKYDRIDGSRVVMLRHPVDTMLSIYFFWLQLADTDYTGHRLFETFRSERPSILQLAAFPTLRRLMSHTYFGGYDMANFSAIGDHANREPYFAWIEEAMDVHVQRDIVDNVTVQTEQRDAAHSDLALRAQMSILLADDVSFYERWAGTFRSMPG